MKEERGINYPRTNFLGFKENRTIILHLSEMNWNTQNELKSIMKGSEPTYYQYSNGERIRKFTDKGTIKEERIYLGNFEIYRKFDNASSLIIERQTVHVNDDTGRIAMLEKRTFGSVVDDNDTKEELIRYIYSNHLQSASLELDEDGAIISYEEYHPYGTTSYQANNANIKAVAKRYRYTGKERDEESGLYYHGARYYVPWLARWAAVDPLESEYAGMSSYNYGFNNPVIFNDPSGMEGEEQVSGGFESGVGTSGNPVQLATVDIVENRDLPWYTSFGFNEYGYYRNEYSEEGFSDPYNYVRFLDNAAGSIWNLGADIFHSFKNFSFEGLKNEVVGYYNYYTQTGISEQWEDTKASFIVMFSDIKTYENLVPLLLLKRPTTTVTAVSYEFKNITTTLTNTITTSEGFLFGGFTIKAPFNIPVQRFGNIGLNRRDFWGARIGTSQFANRTFAAIHPRFGNPLTQYTTGVIPKGTSIKFGIIGPQGWKYPGGSFQFIVPSRNVINQSTKLTPR